MLFGYGTIFADQLILKKNNLKGAGGFFLPLSGGADSTATASIVFNLC